jgi:hypothetical protein
MDWENQPFVGDGVVGEGGVSREVNDEKCPFPYTARIETLEVSNWLLRFSFRSLEARSKEFRR